MLPELKARGQLAMGPAAPALRCALGPVAWVVLESLAERSVHRSGATVSEMSVRGVAAEIGLAKDTVARAIQRLQRAGLVRRIDARLTDGRFGHGCYVLVIPHDLFHVCPTRVPSPTTRRTATKSSRRLRTTRPSRRHERDALMSALSRFSEVPDFKSRICTMVPAASRSAFSRDVQPC